MANVGDLPDVDPVYYGHDGFRKFWRDFHEAWETLSMESATRSW